MGNVTRYRAAEHRLFADAGVDPVEHDVELSGLGQRTRVLEVGTGAPVVFLHGGPMAAATWTYVAAGASGLRCLLVERPGTGLSPPPARVPGVEQLRPYLERLTVDVLDAFALERAALVGSSLGGAAALWTALSHPGRVDGVVLAGCPAFVPGWRQPSFFALLRTPVVGDLLLRAPATERLVRRSLEQMGEGRALADGRIPEPMLAWTRAWQRDTATMRNDAAMIRACGTRTGGFDRSLDLDDRDLAAVQAPCLLLAGTEDPVGDDRVMRDLAARLPNAEVDRWDGAGHLPWLGEPARAAAAISAFVRRASVP